MTDEEVDAALREVCSCSDPFNRYSRVKEVGAGYVVLHRISIILALCYCFMFFRASGTVYIAVDKQSDQRVAIKEIDLSKQPKREMILNEIYVMKDITHPNLVNFLDAYYIGDKLFVGKLYLKHLSQL